MIDELGPRAENPSSHQAVIKLHETGLNLQPAWHEWPRSTRCLLCGTDIARLALAGPSSVPSMQATSTLKKRTPFAFAGDGDNSPADATILDDEGRSSCTRAIIKSSNNLSEQEEVIRTLKTKNDTSDRQIWLYLRIIVGCFAFLSVPVRFYSCDPLKVASLDTLYISFEEQTPSARSSRQMLSRLTYPSTYHLHCSTL